MGKMKIHELAKELGVASKEIIEKAQKLGLKITSHLSNIDEEQANQIRKQYSNKAEKNTGKTTEGENNKKEKKEKSSPVIIRREVILSDDEEEKKEEKKDNRRKDVGFVERRNKDYNIVYRNKTVKPLTVNELFGLGKKEEKKEEKKEIKKEEKKETTIKEDSEKIMPKVEEKKEETVVTANKTASDTKPAVEPEVNKPRFHNNNNNNNRNYNPNYNRRENSNNNYNNRGYNRNNQQNRNNNNFNRNNNQNSNGNNNGYNNNGYNRNNNFNRNNNQNNFGNRPTNGFNKGQRPLDNRRIDKNIKDIMETEIVEKENQRDYSSRAIDKEKSNRYDDNKNKKAPKSRRFNENDEYDEGKLKNLKQVDKLSSMFEDQEGGMLDYYDLSTERGKRGKRKNLKTTDRVKQKIFKLTEITIPESISVKDLAAELKKTSGEVIKKLLELGIMATINQELDFDTAFLIAQEFGVTANKKATVNEEDILFDESEDRPEDLVQRPPVVVVMGHVDHGKTSLLDAIRKTNVIEGEAGGITQHIGAYKVSINGREITFLDTPGHEAFTSMRARGAQITDVAILVVAADDGVMPQTIEAINHAKAAEIPIVVAINKIDVPGANPEKVKQELMKYDLVPEEWGGDTIFVEISAKQHINIDQLLEMVLLVSDVRDLKVNPKKQAKGVVIEARLDKAKGPIASVLVQRGSLDVGDTIVAGDIFYEVKDEKMAKHLIEKRERKEREDAMNLYNKVTLDNLFEKMENEDLKQLNIIVKADVQGTAEALKQALEKLSDNEVAVRVIHSNAGAINESDVNLAKAAKAIIIGFNVRPNANAKSTAEKQGVEIKLYSVIYQALEDVEAAMNGLLDPIYEEKVIGNVEVRQTFKISNVGTIAGGYVKEGKIERNAGVRVIREDIVIHEGKLISLKRFKDDVKEVSKGFECGLQIEGYNDLKEGDIIEVYVMEEKPRTRRRKNEQ